MQRAFRPVSRVLTREYLEQHGYDSHSLKLMLEPEVSPNLWPYVDLLLPDISVQPSEYDLLLQLIDPDSRSLTQNTAIILCLTKFLENFVHLFVFFLSLPIYDLQELWALAEMPHPSNPQNTRVVVATSDIDFLWFYKPVFAYLNARFYDPYILDQYIQRIFMDPTYERLFIVKHMLFAEEHLTQQASSLWRYKSLPEHWSHHLTAVVLPRLKKVTQLMTLHLHFHGETRVAAIPTLVQQKPAPETSSDMQSLVNDSEMERYGLARHTKEAEAHETMLQEALNKALFIS